MSDNSTKSFENLSVRSKVVIDGREFKKDRVTGIGRVLNCFLDSLLANDIFDQINLAVNSEKAVPSRFRNNKTIKIKQLPNNYFQSEKTLSTLTKQAVKLFISPYPKIPLFGSFCPTIHTVHDILDLTHFAYKKRFKVHFDKFRLKRALQHAEITWYDSHYSLRETKRFVGCSGKNPKVRYPGIDRKFNTQKSLNEFEVLRKYNLNPGYILIVGNGLPHKNLGVLLEISDYILRRLVFVGVSTTRQKSWQKHFPKANATWINYIEDDELPILMRNSFCLAQPSTAEGYGYPPIEAMACGIPVVVSSIPVLIETTGGYAYVADYNRPKEWIEAFNRLENTNCYNDKSEKGLKWTGNLIGPKGFNRYISDIQKLIRRN